MSYCPQCGAYIPEGDSKCPACGLDPKGFYANGQSAAAQQEYKTESISQKPAVWDTWEKEDNHAYGTYTEKENTYSNEDNAYSSYSTNVRKLSVLSYLGPLFLIPLFLHKDDPYVRFHANQGLTLFLLEGLVSLLFGGLFKLAADIFCLYLAILGIKNARNGFVAKLPWIGNLLNIIK